MHVSTESVLAGRPTVRAIETQVRAPNTPAPYALAQERVLAASCPELATMVMRPRFTWGRGDTSLLPKLVEAVSAASSPGSPGGRYLTSTCHVENVVAGIVAAAERGRRRWSSDRLRSFIGALIESQGLRVPTRSMPFPIAMAMV